MTAAGMFVGPQPLGQETRVESSGRGTSGLPGAHRISWSCRDMLWPAVAELPRSREFRLRMAQNLVRALIFLQPAYSRLPRI